MVCILARLCCFVSWIVNPPADGRTPIPLRGGKIFASDGRTQVLFLCGEKIRQFVQFVSALLNQRSSADPSRFRFPACISRRTRRDSTRQQEKAIDIRCLITINEAMKKGFAAICLFTGLMLSSPLPVRGDATVYWDSDNGFSPATVVIGPGETVTWWNYDPYGFDVTVTFNGSFSFHLLDYQGQGVTFPSAAGTYSYSSNWGDHGAVIVNLPPSVTITNPLNNAVIPAPGTFTIQAVASDTADDYVYDVQFFLGTGDSTNAIADVFSPPFTTSVTGLVAGTYVVIAVATDSHGAQTTNAITVNVSGGAAVNLNAPRISAGKFLFDVTGLTSGKTNVLQTSTNLISWQPAKTNVAAGSAMTLTNTPSSGSHYYRLLQLP
jgi:plastocyanin